MTTSPPPPDTQQPLNSEGGSGKPTSPRASKSSSTAGSEPQPINAISARKSGSGVQREHHVHARYAAILNNRPPPQQQQQQQPRGAIAGAGAASGAAAAVAAHKAKIEARGLNHKTSRATNATVAKSTTATTTSPRNGKSVFAENVSPFKGAMHRSPTNADALFKPATETFEHQNPLRPESPTAETPVPAVSPTRTNSEMGERKRSFVNMVQRRFSKDRRAPDATTTTTTTTTVQNDGKKSENETDDSRPQQVALSTTVLDVVQRSRERRRTESNVDLPIPPPPPPPLLHTDSENPPSPPSPPPPPPPTTPSIAKPRPSPLAKQSNRHTIAITSLPPPPPPPAHTPFVIASKGRKTTASSMDGRKTTTTSSFTQLLDDDIVDDIIRRHGWRGRMPTNNPHVFEALVLDPTPFGDRSLTVMNNKVVSAIMENLYFSGLQRRDRHRMRFNTGDVVVLGVPRVGQTPILRILDYLRTGKLSSGPGTKRRDLILRVPWLEAPYGDVPISSGGGISGKVISGRLFKSYLPPRTVVGFDPSTHSPMVFKVVAVLRDPLDLRLSWFRHIRRIFRKTAKNPTEARLFDEQLSFQQFEMEPYPSGDILHFHSEYTRTYEDYVLEVINLYTNNPANVCVVFYEELFRDTQRVAQRLREFTGWGRTLGSSLDVIVNAITDDTDHPIGGTRVGCSGQGAEYMSKIGTRVVDELWALRVRAHFLVNGHIVHDTYHDLYEKFTDSNYSLTGLPIRDLEPFAVTEPLSVTLMHRASSLSSTIVARSSDLMKRSSNLGSEMVKRGSNLSASMVRSTHGKSAKSVNNMTHVKEEDDEDDDGDDALEVDDVMGDGKKRTTTTFVTGKDEGDRRRSLRASSLLGMLAMPFTSKKSTGNALSGKKTGGSTLSMWSASTLSHEKSRGAGTMKSGDVGDTSGGVRIDPDETDDEL